MMGGKKIFAKYIYISDTPNERSKKLKPSLKIKSNFLVNFY